MYMVHVLAYLGYNSTNKKTFPTINSEERVGGPFALIAQGRFLASG